MCYTERGLRTSVHGYLPCCGLRSLRCHWMGYCDLSAAASGPFFATLRIEMEFAAHEMSCGLRSLLDVLHLFRNRSSSNFTAAACGPFSMCYTGTAAIRERDVPLRLAVPSRCATLGLQADGTMTGVWLRLAVPSRCATLRRWRQELQLVQAAAACGPFSMCYTSQSPTRNLRRMSKLRLAVPSRCATLEYGSRELVLPA